MCRPEFYFAYCGKSTRTKASASLYTSGMALELIKGAALLLALSYLETFVWRYSRGNAALRQVCLGVLFGVICVIGMMAPLQFSSGIIFDARSVIIGVAGLFGGPVAGGIAAAIAGGYRLWLGGAGAPVGVLVIVFSLAAGLLYRYGRERYDWSTGIVQLFAFGLILHIVCIGCFMLLPGDAPARILDTVAVPYIAVFTPATVLLAWLIGDSHKQIKIAEELQATTEALAESERRFRAISDNSPNAITLKDADGHYLIVNRTFAKWQGVEPEDMIGRSLRDILPKDQAETIIEQDAEVVAVDEITHDESVRNFADGQRRDVKVTKVPISLAGGGPRVVLTILTDITGFKDIEQELRSARDEAVAASKTKSEFLARMSHEFRTPLNAILGFSDILCHGHLGDIPRDRAESYAADIHASAEMLLELVNDLLDVAAIEEGRIRLEYADIDIAATIAESMRNIDARLKTKRIKLDVAVPDGLRPLPADRRALKQILLNLLTNAVKFTPDGGTIKLVVTQNDADTEVVVSDNGTGIDEDLLLDLLSTTQRHSANTYRTEEGWGLGLSIVRGLVELHGGQMSIESTVGEGTVVAVSIPNVRRSKGRDDENA